MLVVLFIYSIFSRCIVSAQGSTPHLVTWYKDGRQLPSTGRGTSEILVVNNVGREDRGMYQCIVRRAEGDTAQASAELQLGGKVFSQQQFSFYPQRKHELLAVSLNCLQVTRILLPRSVLLFLHPTNVLM